MKYLIPLLLLVPLASNAGEIEVNVNPMTDTSRYLYSFKSTTTSANSIGTQETSTMILRCEGRSKDLYFTTPTYNADNTSVGVRWDKQGVESQYWNQSKGSDAFFTRTPIKFMQKMLNHSRLAVSWRPYSRVQQYASFDLKPHHGKISQMIKNCS